MKPRICRIVIVKNFESNGVDEHPAIITRVWSLGTGPMNSDCINVTILPDCGAPACKTSVYLFANRAQADQYLKSNPGGALVCFWPDRDREEKDERRES